MADSRSLELQNGIGTTSSAHLDAKYKVADDTERDALITNQQVELGMQIYHTTDNVIYWLEEYPTVGSTTGAVWTEVGSGSESLGNEVMYDLDDVDGRNMADVWKYFKLESLLYNIPEDNYVVGSFFSVSRTASTFYCSFNIYDGTGTLITTLYTGGGYDLTVTGITDWSNVTLVMENNGYKLTYIVDLSSYTTDYSVSLTESTGRFKQPLQNVTEFKSVFNEEFPTAEDNVTGAAPYLDMGKVFRDIKIVPTSPSDFIDDSGSTNEWVIAKLRYIVVSDTQVYLGPNVDGTIYSGVYVDKDTTNYGDSDVYDLVWDYTDFIMTVSAKWNSLPTHYYSFGSANDSTIFKDIIVQNGYLEATSFNGATATGTVTAGTVSGDGNTLTLTKDGASDVVIDVSTLNGGTGGTVEDEDKQIFADSVSDANATTGAGLNLKTAITKIEFYARDIEFFKNTDGSYKQIELRTFSHFKNATRTHFGINVGIENLQSTVNSISRRVLYDNTKATNEVYPLEFNYNIKGDTTPNGVPTRFTFKVYAAWNSIADQEYDFVSNNRNAYLNITDDSFIADPIVEDISQQTLAMFNDSSIKVLPYLYKEGLDWTQNTKIPRTNLLMLTDHNDEPLAMRRALQWVYSDGAVSKAIPCALLQGDFLTAFQTTSKQALYNIFTNWLSGKPNDLPILWSYGNHDLGEDAISDISHRPLDSELRTNIFDLMYNLLPADYQANFVWGGTDRLYYRCDIPNTDIRVISLNQFEYPLMSGTGGRTLKYSATGQYESNVLTYGFNMYYSKEQIQFLYDQLTETGVSGKTVILMTHIPIGDVRDNANAADFVAHPTAGDGTGQNALENHNIALRHFLKKYNEGGVTTVTFNNSADIASDTNGNNNTVLHNNETYDFSVANSKVGTTKILNVRGHVHNFDFDYLETDAEGEITPSIQNMSAGEASPFIDINNGISTVSDYGADIISINEDNDEVYVVRYGSRKTQYGSKDLIGTDEHGFNFITRPIKLTNIISFVAQIGVAVEGLFL